MMVAVQMCKLNKFDFATCTLSISIKSEKTALHYNHLLVFFLSNIQNNHTSQCRLKIILLHIFFCKVEIVFTVMVLPSAFATEINHMAHRQPFSILKYFFTSFINWLTFSSSANLLGTQTSR